MEEPRGAVARTCATEREVERADTQGRRRDIDTTRERAVARPRMVAVEPARALRRVREGLARSCQASRGPDGLTLARHGWGTAQPTFRQILTSLFFPGASAELMAAFNELQRRTTSPENAARLGHAIGDFDV